MSGTSGIESDGVGGMPAGVSRTLLEREECRLAGAGAGEVSAAGARVPERGWLEPRREEGRTSVCRAERSWAVSLLAPLALREGFRPEISLLETLREEVKVGGESVRPRPAPFTGWRCWMDRWASCIGSGLAC